MPSSNLHFDPADPQTHADPYPVYQRLREEAPLYYNDERDFYAVSRFEDIAPGGCRLDFGREGRRVEWGPPLILPHIEPAFRAKH